MKKTIDRLRKAHQEYLAARQARYDELAAGDHAPFINILSKEFAMSGNAYALHTDIVNQIDNEETGVDYETIGEG